MPESLSKTDNRDLNQLFAISYGLYTGSTILKEANLYSLFGNWCTAITQITTAAACMLLFLKYITDLKNLRDIKQIAIFVVVLIGGIYSYLLSKSSELIIAILFIFAAKDIELRTIAKISLFVHLILVSTIALCASFEVIPSYYMYDIDRGVRSSMGFTHPNVFASYLIFISVDLYTLLFNKNIYILIISCIGCLIVNEMIAHSKTTQLVLVLQLTIYLISYIFRYKERWLAHAALLIFILCASFSIIIMITYTSDNPVHYWLNTVLHDRLRLGHQAYEYSGITLFGSDFSDAPIQGFSLAEGRPVTFYVDNSFMRLILRFGLFGFLLLMLPLIAVLLFRSRSQIFDYISFGIVILAIMGISESFFIDIQSNYFLMVVACLLYGDSSISITYNKT